MPPIKREPPGGPAERLSSNVLAGGRDVPCFKPWLRKTLARPRRGRSHRNITKALRQ